MHACMHACMHARVWVQGYRISLEQRVTYNIGASIIADTILGVHYVYIYGIIDPKPRKGPVI